MTRQFLPSVNGDGTLDEIKLACLRVGSAFYALDIMAIREIIRPLPIVAVPHAPAYIDGVITLRKAVIPVVDLRRRFGVNNTQVEARERIVICAVEGRIVGLFVDEISEIASFPRDEIRPAPYYMSGPDSEFFPAVCRYRGRLLLLINLKKILSCDQTIDAEKIQKQALEDQTD